MFGLSYFGFYKLCWCLVFVLPVVPIFLRFSWNRWIEPKLAAERTQIGSDSPGFSARVGRGAIATLRCGMIGVSALAVGICLWSAQWIYDHPIREYTWVEPRYSYDIGPLSGRTYTRESNKGHIELGAERSFGAHSVKVTDDGYGNFFVTVRYVQHYVLR